MFNSFVTLKNPLRYLLIFFLFFAVAAYIFRGRGALSDSSKTLLTVTSFVFGFYINNLISHARNRHGKVVESLREEGGYIKAIYFNLQASFSAEVAEGEQKIIDEYLTTSMDYRTYDYAKCSPQFEEMYKSLINLRPETKKQDATYGQIIRIISELSKNRTRVETLVKERISMFEWLIISALLAVVLYFVYALNSGTLLSVILTSLIATSITMLLVVLYSLDSLRWKEDKWFWDPLEELFTSLDLIPYFPKTLVDLGRVKPVKGHPVRLAECPYPYPNISDKKIILYKSWGTDSKQSLSLQ